MGLMSFDCAPRRDVKPLADECSGAAYALPTFLMSFVSPMHHPFAACRAYFPILKQQAQLASCSQSALSVQVLGAVQAYLESWQTRGMDWAGWMQAVQEAKAQFAHLIGANPQDIAVAGSVADATSAVASALHFEQGKEVVVVGESDFPSQGHVWLAQEPRGARVRFAAAQADRCITPTCLEAAMDDSTLLVHVSHVAYDSGYIQDLAAIQRMANKHGAMVFVDAYQSAGALDIDVVRDQVDILVAGAQKFMLGCPGIAFLYVRPGLATTLQPTHTGWFGRCNPFAFDIRGLDFPDNASRFNTGTPPMVNAFAARAGLQLLNSLNRRAVQDYLLDLAQLGRKEAMRMGLKPLVPDTEVSTLTTAILVRDAASCEQQLRGQGFITSARHDVLRIAPHFYNTRDEVIGAVRALAAMCDVT